MDKVQDAELRKAWTAFDRATAYGCRIRKVPYNRELCKKMWKQYCDIRDRYYGPKEHSDPFFIGG